MLDQFQAHIDRHLPFLQGKRLLLACSGGLDSVVLAHLAKGIGLDVDLAHCNFQLRGEESEGDEAFVRRLAKELGVGALARKFDTLNHARERRISIQMAARELRYQWFAEVLGQSGHAYVLTAHHADDNLETFLINLSRGSGIEGLLGIPQVNDRVVRPLLPFSREALWTHAQREKIHWREDSSNERDDYLRNKIRHTVVPRLRELHPGFLQNFERTRSNLQQAHGLMDDHVREVRERLFQERDRAYWISLAALRDLGPREAILFFLFQPYGFKDPGEVDRLMGAMSGKFLLSKSHKLLRDREHFILSSRSVVPREQFSIPESGGGDPLPISLSMEPVGRMGKPDRLCIYVDREKLKFPLLLRKWEPGDYFYPFGLGGRKKLAKFFKDEKVDRNAKERQWLLCSDGDILWVVGRRADERFKVDGSTQQILKITWNS